MNSTNETKIFDYPIEWVEIDNNDYTYASTYHDRKLLIRVNPEFPDLPLYTLRVNEKEISFDNWPKAWDR